MSLDDRINDACHRIEELYYETDGHCYVSFSGGKDSTVLLALIKMCEDLYTIPEGAIPAVFSNTGIELGVTVEFVKWVKENYYPNVITIRPEVSFDWVLKNKGKPVLSKLKSEYIGRWQRGIRSDSVYRNLVIPRGDSVHLHARIHLADKYCHMLDDHFPIRISEQCCKYLKKGIMKRMRSQYGMNGQMTGIRNSEGGARAMNAETRNKHGTDKICTAYMVDGIKKSPLIDWTEDDVEQFISKYNVPLSDAYTMYGFYRTGCMACPYARDLHHDLEYLHNHEPNRYTASMHWLKDVYIAQDVRLPFDEDYERERERMWFEVYEPMRQEMLRKYRPNSRLIKDCEQTDIFDFLEATNEVN